MSVITDAGQASLQQDHRCTFCGGFLHYPYVEWHATPDDPDAEGVTVTICKQCCQNYGRGLHADLIQINAIVELERLYPDFTLARTTRAQREKESEFTRRNREHAQAAFLKTLR